LGRDGSERKESISNRNRKGKRKRKSQTLTLDLQREKGGRGYGSYLDCTSHCHHHRRAAWTRSGQDTRADARPCRHATSLRTRAKGTDVGPFDGGALTHGWTRAPAKGPAAVHRPTSSPSRHGHSLDLAPCGAREEGEEATKKEMKRGASAAACRLASSPSPAPPLTGALTLTRRGAHDGIKGKGKAEKRGERAAALCQRHSSSPSSAGTPDGRSAHRRHCARERFGGEEKKWS
jgi:hypothetical protein